ncbi:copper homeostasis protein CutC [Sporosarcina sp. FSL K6-2383]|uniref:copper homeostasis protein CutC n=1 Tax=Sporosarcina sp. FSL K6-2383 TaxID=2921556 RepID=UPI00315A749A
MMLEIIATSVADAIAAERSGADRLELCAALSEGGLTPSLGLVKAVVQAVDIPVHVIVRPHSRTFQYVESDLVVMLADIRYIQKAGAAGIVIGVLDEDNKVNAEALSRLLQEAGEMKVTFHRAFDDIDDQLEAIEVIASFPQIQRILTSGGQAPAPEAAEQLKKLVDKSRNTSVRILAGNGMSPETLSVLVKATGLEEVHFGSAVRVNRSFMHPIDEAVITGVKSELMQLRK